MAMAEILEETDEYIVLKLRKNGPNNPDICADDMCLVLQNTSEVELAEALQETYSEAYVAKTIMLMELDYGIHEAAREMWAAAD